MTKEMRYPETAYDQMPLFGAHMSIAGGLANAFARLDRVDGHALQIFTKNQRQWFAAPLTAAEIAGFNAARKQWGDLPIGAHDSYLINLANPEKKAAARSINAFSDEIHRCAQLTIPYLIMHPGSHLGAGIPAGLATLTANLDRAIAQAASDSVTILLETTAGQGTGLGARFDELAYVLEHSRFAKQLGVCLDTCHIFAAGYDIRTSRVYERSMREFDRKIGLDRLKFIHLNDSKKELASRVDRHEHIGQGHIGLAGFRLLVNDPRFADLPMVLETPKQKDLAADRENLAVLKKVLVPGL
jgi:deoxyribonuclease-4